MSVAVEFSFMHGIGSQLGGKARELFKAKFKEKSSDIFALKADDVTVNFSSLDIGSDCEWMIQGTESDAPIKVSPSDWTSDLGDALVETVRELPEVRQAFLGTKGIILANCSSGVDVLNFDFPVIPAA